MGNKNLPIGLGRVSRGLTRACLILVCVGTGLACAEPRWVLDPGSQGPDLPPAGRSLFDRLIGTAPVPFPFESLIRRVESELAPGGYLGRPIKQVLIPLGRSLQRLSAAPEPFHFPRAVVAVDGEPADRPGEGALLLRDRLYLGYQEKAAVLEVISYNETAGRFEYQVVRDYREGGARQVAYATRTLCLSCHQNGSPIFARPQWDETNANTRVRARLAGQGRDFYGMPLDPGLDEPYAIDLATDRANGFALTQLLWSEGCGASPAGAACRAALLRGAIQWGLSGGRGLDDRSPGFRQTLLVPLATHRDHQWPDGLKIPNPDIPNRLPLEPGRPLPAGAAESAATALFGASDIPAVFEPLSPRPPLEVWQPTDQALAERAVSGLAEFLAGSDLRRLDERLAALPAPETVIAAACALDGLGAADGGETLRLSCTDPALGLDARLIRRPDGSLGGRIPALRLAGEDLGEVRLATDPEASARSDPETGAGTLRLRPFRLDQATRLRLIDGRRVSAVEIEPAAAGRAQVRVAVVDDFAPLAAVLADLAKRDDAALSADPFQRPLVLDALLTGLGAPRLTWCCADDGRLPPPIGPAQMTEAKLPALDPFFRICGRCHRTPDDFPPNFLAGTPAQVAGQVEQCAERIAYRLGMWTLAESARPKTPMPPHRSLAVLGVDPAHWVVSDRFVALRTALAQFTADRGRPLPDLKDLLARDYRGLRPCLVPALAGNPDPSPSIRH